jgi:SnoaL-like domain
VNDREAITDQIYRYCRAMDRIDAALGYSIWHPDGTADYGANVFQGSGRDFVDHVCAQHLGTLTHSHQVTNIIIELNGDHAGSESYCTANLRIMRGDVLAQISVWNRYIDTWSKRGGRWAIDHRIAIIDFDEMRPVAAMSQTSRGSRDRKDPSYQVLK